MTVDGGPDGETAKAEAREGNHKPTGTMTGENTDAGAETTAGYPTTQHGSEKTAELDKVDLSRETSNQPSRCPSPQHATESTEDQTVLTFAKGDLSNPYNWSNGKKTYVLLTCMALVLNSTIGSALPAGAIEEIQVYFNITNQSLLVLPVSIYLIGYVLGPLCFAPLSEYYGRKWIVIATFVVFTAFHLGCALAPTFSGLIIMRLLVGIGSSTPVSVIGGIYADIYSTPKARGRAVTGFMAATTWGPLAGPIISGYVAPISWRWAFWSGLIIAGATWPFVIFLPETYGPVLLKHKAEKLRKETGRSDIVAPSELEEQSWTQFITVVLTRPVRMFLFEWIVLFSCLYLSVAYAIFYIFFQSYPIIFGGIYGFNSGQTGLTFLPIGVGAMLAGFVYVYWERYLEKAKARCPPPMWSQQEEYVRLPIAVLGAPLFAISLFWLGWTARPDIHWIVPTLSALPFGIGFLLIFMALINYIVDAYEIYAASAMGAASCSRSIFGVVMPFAARPMYETLGVAWACSLLGFLSILMGIVPFAFLKYGAKIRENSTWCQELKRKKVEDQEKQRRLEQQQQQHRSSSDLEKQA
ncbi:Putative major facilitator superfamily, MFS transporter superfamily [Septoria linicola]|uniref:Major facilitator superfamily, MFS transporter superfamily n=1 Tax=Septoria linicola TaxID=215465 RepID=A0A9Q9AK28_9PEZI|nr:Putative major facilitator superfamily, MFS transporter superfamily [Septoria linicola]